MPKRDDKVVEIHAVDIGDPSYCPHCQALTMTCFPVHLREKDGTDTLICHAVKCAKCDRLKHYGGKWAIGKLHKNTMLTRYDLWPELQRNNITGEQFLDAVFKHPEGHIWLDANNGLEPVKPEGNQAQALKRLQEFFSHKGRGLVRV